MAIKLQTPIAIVGLGASGNSVHELLLELGYKKDEICTFDDKNSIAEFRDPASMITVFKPKTLVVSPGYPLSSSWIQEYRKTGCTITSEIEIAFSVLTNERVIAITGSVGKSTTVSLLQAGLKSFSKTGFAGGNLGIPLAVYAKEVLSGKRQKADWVVLELSSYQLENFPSLKVDFSALTYLTPNHLERYPSLEDYYKTKTELIHRTKLACVLNENGGDLRSFVETHNFKTKLHYVSKNSATLNQLGITTCGLVGSHNMDNLAVAVELATLAKWPPVSIPAMCEYRGLPHRLENLGVHDGIQFINDSKATTIESVLQALNSLKSEVKESSRIVLLLGGKDKNLPWEKLAALKGDSLVFPILFGHCRTMIAEKAGLKCLSFETLALCLAELKSHLKSEDIVLLSPGGTSLDEFKSFEHRGDFFKKWVTEITN